MRRRVDSLFAQWDKPESPGCALGIVQNGQLAYRRGYGTANLASGSAITPATAFYAASVSKQFTAASTALAASHGYLSLDDDIRRYVPELPDYGRPITIKHLIHHTGGVRDYLTLLALTGTLADPHGDGDLLQLLGRQKSLNFTPGAEYSYSNSGYYLLSVIIKRATGKSLREFAAEHLFRPLGMRSTYFYDDHTHSHPAPDRAIGYQPDEHGAFRSAVFPNFDQVGDGGLYTTVEDLFLWDQNFYHQKVGGDRLIQQLHTRGTLANDSILTYAFALVIGDYNGIRTVEHGGSFMGYRTVILRFPEERFSVICLCNLGTIDPGAIARGIADLYLADRIDLALAEYVGEYRSEELGATYELQTQDGALMLQRRDASRTRLKSVGQDRFLLDSGLGPVTVAFRRDPQHRIAGFAIEAGRARNIQFVRQ